LLCLFVIQTVYAQSNGEIKDLFESLNGQDPITKHKILADFQKVYPKTYPPIYYLYAKNALNTLEGLDPLSDQKAINYYLSLGKTMGSLFPVFASEDNINQSVEVYRFPADLTKSTYLQSAKDSAARVVSNIDFKLTTINEAIDYLSIAIVNYLDAQALFLEINGSQNRLSDLYLYADDDLIQKIEQVGVLFDSTLQNLESYNQKIGPVFPEHVKTAVLTTPNHFKMSGMTPANFSQDTVQLWNYRTWSNNFQKALETEVKGLKNEISFAFDSLQERQKQEFLGKKCFENQEEQGKILRINNLIRKYDNTSLVAELFDYFHLKGIYADKFSYHIACNPLNQLVQEDELTRRARALKKINIDYRVTDSTLNQLLVSKGTVPSFQWFFDTYYDGNTSSRIIATQEKTQLKNSFSRLIEDLVQGYEGAFTLPKSEDRIEPVYVLNDTVYYEAKPGTSYIEPQLYPFNDTVQIGHYVNAEGSPSILMVHDFDSVKKIAWSAPFDGADSLFKVLSDSTVMYKRGQELVYASTTRPEIYTVPIAEGQKVFEVKFNKLTETMTVFSTKTDQDNLFIGRGKNGKLNSTELTMEPEENYIGMFRQGGSFYLFATKNADLGFELKARELDMTNLQQKNTYDYLLKYEYNQPVLIKNDDSGLTLVGKNPSSDLLYYSTINYEGEVLDEQSY
jgi:hypothetical protein